MSVVVAAVQDGIVYMGSDSGCTANVQYLTGSKVWKTGEVLYGLVGTVESCSAIQHSAKLPGSVINVRSGGTIKEEVDLEHWAYHAVLSRVKESLQKAHVTEPNFTLMMGIRGRVFLVEENALFEVMRPYAAIGSAEQIALGALYAKLSQRGVKPDPRKVIAIAIDAACEFSPDCVHPAVIRDGK
jgi:ATP-dependent protease HslVU (ClpYQ) peptidase subunit